MDNSRKNSAVALLVIFTFAISAAAQTKTYTPPKTAWGDPDLQGIWPGNVGVPMQRPANLGERTTLNQLFHFLETGVRGRDASLPEQKPVHKDFRPGDVRHSLADISKAQRLLGYAPTQLVAEGLNLVLEWYCRNVD